MKMHVYSFWDLDLEEHTPIWAAKNKAAAKRVVQATIASAPDSMIAQHPDRYELVDHGTFDADNYNEPFTLERHTLGLVSALIAPHLDNPPPDGLAM